MPDSSRVVPGDAIKAQHSCGKKCGKIGANRSQTAHNSYKIRAMRIPLSPPETSAISRHITAIHSKTVANCLAPRVRAFSFSLPLKGEGPFSKN